MSTSIQRAARVAFLLMALVSARSGVAQQVGSQPTYRELFRPQFHFSPATNWTNDPNGLVYHDGEYHLFYQHNPFGTSWGHMSWGHAVSRDLVHWEHLDVAIPETGAVMAFSGSAVSDVRNTSGFGTSSNPPLVAIYTGHHTDRPLQDQRIAYSLDNGRTWTQYEGNPVLDLGMADFRDPKVVWYEPGEKWVMVVALPTEYRVRFYESKNLREWELLSEFGPAGSTGGIWECPDLFPIEVDGEEKWVLVVNVNPGAPSGGSGAQYFVGTFDGERFVPEEPLGAGEALWIDYGKDFYAVQSWANIPEEDGRRIWLAWMSNWEYSGATPTVTWRNAMTVPRAVTLRRFPEGLRLVQEPVAELQRLRGRRIAVAGREVAPGMAVPGVSEIKGARLEIIAEFEVGEADEFGLRVRKGDWEETVVGYDAKRHRLFVDRGRSGRTDFSGAFPGRHSGPLAPEDGRVRLHLLVDDSSVEVFGNGGRLVLTETIFPSPESDGVEVYATGGRARLVSLEAWMLDSIWAAPARGEAPGS